MVAGVHGSVRGPGGAEFLGLRWSPRASYGPHRAWTGLKFLQHEPMSRPGSSIARTSGLCAIRCETDFPEAHISGNLAAVFSALSAAGERVHAPAPPPVVMSC